MGASGSGKTTLLNVLTGRNLRNLRIGGKVYLNNEVASIGKLKACSAYVQQDDHFIGSLTVREHLRFQAVLRTNSKREHITKRVSKLLDELGLAKAADTRIGYPGISKSISGGEMKRLAFASEIITDPAILFCDEPTSGLDSSKAQSVVGVLKSLAQLGRTIVCTIHQPPSQVSEMFDNLLLLAEGRVAFLGTISESLKFFSNINLICPSNYNPSDFFIAQIAIVPGKESECRDRINNICDKFAKSNYLKNIRPPPKEERSVSEDSSEIFIHKSNLPSAEYKRSRCVQFYHLTHRAMITNIREPLITSVRFAQTIFIALLLGSVYWKQEMNQEGIMNINGALFILIGNVTYVNVISVINTFCNELPIFVREHNNGLYSVGSYFFAKMAAEVPYFIILPTVFSSITYYMIGLNPSTKSFVNLTLLLILVANVSSGFGYFISCISKNITMALTLAPSCLIVLMLFGGLFINNASVPYYLRWIKYLSWFYYGNEILVVNQWDEIVNITCELDKMLEESGIHPYDPIGTFIDCNTTSIADLYLSAQIPSCINKGDYVIQRLSFDKNNTSRNFAICSAILVVIRIMAYLALYFRAKRLR
ncbi:eye pigment precursor family transporter white [Brevipalpus obovatus]|uniref:eye pigment precursor family transporter white n=1 Tax=Brevipalpus obovatus TaxID=246614 RepID=UPI003D9F1541